MTSSVNGRNLVPPNGESTTAIHNFLPLFAWVVGILSLKHSVLIIILFLFCLGTAKE